MLTADTDILVHALADADAEVGRDGAPAVAERLLTIAVSYINDTAASIAPLIRERSPQSDDYRRQLVDRLRAVYPIFDYVSSLPISDELMDICLARRVRLDLLLAKIAAASRMEAEPIVIPEERHRNSTHWLLWLIMPIIVLAISVWAYMYIEDYIAVRQIRNNPTEEGMTAFLLDHNIGSMADDVTAMYLAYMDSIVNDNAEMERVSQFPPLVRMDNLAKNPSLAPDIASAVKYAVAHYADSLYAQAVESDNLKLWYNYQLYAPTDYYYDSSERIDSLEEVVWSDESTAWQAALDANDRDSYTRYVSMYPHGHNVCQAEAKLIDIEVKSYRNRGNEGLQSVDRIADYPGGGNVSRVCIFNQSPYDMAFLMSGPSSKRMDIKAGDSDFVDIDDGLYNVLVLVDNERHDRFSFAQDMHSGIYSSSISLHSERQP